MGVIPLRSLRISFASSLAYRHEYSDSSSTALLTRRHSRQPLRFDNMVIVRLIGGLGNQLFQYALGRTLAASHSTTLKLDITDYETYKVQAYALRHFNVIESFATRDEIRRLRGGGWMARQPSRRLHRLIPFRRDSYVLEKGFAFDPEVLKSPEDVYLEGYWQSEKYFTSIEGLLRRQATSPHLSIGRDPPIPVAVSRPNVVI